MIWRVVSCTICSWVNDRTTWPRPNWTPLVSASKYRIRKTESIRRDRLFPARLHSHCWLWPTVCVSITVTGWWKLVHSGDLPRSRDHVDLVIQLEHGPSSRRRHHTEIQRVRCNVRRRFEHKEQRRLAVDSHVVHVGGLMFYHRFFFFFLLFLLYPAIHNIGRDTKFTVCFSVLLHVCTVTDFSAGALPIRVKFFTAVRPHLRQVFSYFGLIAPGMGINRSHMAGYASCWNTCFLFAL